MQTNPDPNVTWNVAPPEDGFPYPSIGYRLMKATDENIFGWVCIMLGDKTVLQQVADRANKDEKFNGLGRSFPLLKDSTK
jgi:hypothetical protein